MVEESPRQSNHLPVLDGLRGMACLAVVIHHCYVHCGRYQCAILRAGNHEYALSRLLFYGYGGVELFFVLSGFCLAYPYFVRSRPDGWGRYFAKRAIRILPPYYAAALAILGLQLLLYLRWVPFVDASLQGPSALPSLTSLVVCFTMLGVGLNPSFWTLVVEAKWYFALPVVLFCWRRSRLLTFVLVGLLAASVAPLTRTVRHFEALFSLLFLYLPVFLLGIWAADLTARGVLRAYGKHLRWLVLASLVLMAIVLPAEPDGGFMRAARIAPWGLFAFSLLLASIHDPLFERFARSRALIFVGSFSYSLYLIHEPLIHFVFETVPQASWSPWGHFAFFELVLVPVCVTVGYLFYCAVERPTQRWAKRWFAQPHSGAPLSSTGVGGQTAQARAESPADARVAS